MRGVFDPAGIYRSAVAELPLHARSSGHVAGAIGVVFGVDDWIAAVARLQSEGAVAVVVSDPDVTSVQDIRHLVRHTRIPVVLERPLLRADAAAAALAGRNGHAPRLLVADGAARPGAVDVVARELCGWVRILAGQQFAVAAADTSLALLTGAAGVPAAISVVSVRRRGSGHLRVQALGEVITDVRVEGRETRMSTSSAAGSLVAPVLYESSERVALRRAFGALASPALIADLEELALDSALVRASLAAAP